MRLGPVMTSCPFERPDSDLDVGFAGDAGLDRDEFRLVAVKHINALDRFWLVRGGCGSIARQCR